MSNITPPKYVKTVLKTLQSHGHNAYLVGGCVRDMILGVYPQDWDICTGALPDEVLAIFPLSRPTGIRHGTVTVTVNSRSVEVTTFRLEGTYADHRHPDEVSFVGDLTADLSRRDFTMNAIALPADGLVVDPFGGVEDIHARLIRCVGEPERRFREDALRMLRALRFSARLNFDIEEHTMAALLAGASLAACLAGERVRDELEKILLSPRPEMTALLFSCGLMDSFVDRRPGEKTDFAALPRLPRKSLPRWAALCVILLRSGSIASVESFLSALRLDSRTIRCCIDAASITSLPVPSEPVSLKRLLRKYGVDAVTCAADCSDALTGGSTAKELKAVLKSGDCFSMKRLAVSGDDLLSLGFRGRELGEMLNFLLDYVMEYPENNRRELLLLLANRSEDS